MEIIKTRILITLLSIILTSCVPSLALAPTKTPMFTLAPAPTSTATLTPIPQLTNTPILVIKTPPSPTILPTQSKLTYAVITPEPAELKRWREYEEALGNALYERVQIEDIICEWLIVGRSEREVYVWAACSGLRPYDSKITTCSRYTVVYLGVEREVQTAVTGENIPGSPAESRRKLFPPSILERFEHIPPVDRLLEHLETRRDNPEPPLIVLDATPTP